MRDRHQDSDAAQSGRPGKESDDDRMGPHNDVDETKPMETVHSSHHQGEEEKGLGLDGGYDESDTDRVELGDESSSELLAVGKEPARVEFKLRRIRSTSAKCFFCKASGCDQVFVARSMNSHRVKAYAVHNACVVDHETLQRVASGGT